MDSDHIYFARRAEEERAAAAAATSEAARESHAQLASRYQDVADSLERLRMAEGSRPTLSIRVKNSTETENAPTR